MGALPPKRTGFRAHLHRLGKRLRRSPASQEPGLHITEHFRQKANQQGYSLSHSQQRVIQHMAQQAARLEPAHSSPVPGHSLYLHGAVGRGKSWLLNGFFQAIALREKRRLHFHDFFAQLHQGMFRLRDRQDPLAATLDELLDDCRLLCFDEFHVHDIGDAMLIARLFKALFERNICLLVTSNYSPEGLLPNPLYHQRFLPVIKLINAHMQVFEVGGPHDYRSQPQSGAGQVFTQGHYVWPGTPDQRKTLQLPPLDNPALPLAVGSRQLRARMCHERTIGLAFSDICEQPTAVMDYLELSRRFDTWIIDKLPNLEDCSIAAQQRFINLIDVLYDQDKRLLLIGERPLGESLGGAASDLARTRSRLGQLTAFGPCHSPA